MVVVVLAVVAIVVVVVVVVRSAMFTGRHCVNDWEVLFSACRYG